MKKPIIKQKVNKQGYSQVAGSLYPFNKCLFGQQ